MAVLMVPKDETVYPTLGPQVCAWIEEYLVFGPGDLRGQPVVLDKEKRALIYRFYEVYPKDHPNAFRRRFKRVGISLVKGSAKTELAAWIAAAELHPEAPVRCDGLDAHGNLVGFGVTDPYIPMVAYTEEQSDELAYYALKTILEYSPLVDDFDIGIERIMRVDGDGKAVSLASSPDSRDGALTTFQVCDETHHWTTQRLIDAHKTMLANLAKRKMADPWSLETTTAFYPGEGSVAEKTMEYARKINDGKIKDVHLFFFHRYASDTHDLETREGVRAAVIEACGPTAAWRDLDAICDQFEDPTTEKPYLKRVWLNQLVQGSEKAFDFQKWEGLKSDYKPHLGDSITLGFDGARFRDSVGLVATHLKTGFQWMLGVWEKPENDTDWEAPQDEIDIQVNGAFTMFNVIRMYCDPQFWESHVAEWAGKYGEKKVIAWHTNRMNQMVYAIRGFNNSILAKELTHDGNPDYSRHIGNAVRKKVNIVDDHGEPFWLIFKERADSPKKIDLAMAGILSWQARCDALKTGAPDNNLSIYETRGMVVV